MTETKNKIPHDIKVYIDREKNSFELHDLKYKLIFIRPYKELVSQNITNEKIESVKNVYSVLINRVIERANKHRPDCSAEGRRILNWFEKELREVIEVK
jgi:hypothetical protein